MKRNKETLWELKGTIKRNILLITGVPKGKERKKWGQKAYLKKQWLRKPQTWGEIWTSKFIVNKPPQIFHPKQSSTRHIIIKLSKIKDKKIILKASKF